jgi:pimeloyl-ACP methyl ester carboxylesterase
VTAPSGELAVAWATPRTALVEGIEVRWREAGVGPALVLLHGLGLSADFWWRNGPPLSVAGFRVLAPDLPGFGRTEGPPLLAVPEQAAAAAAWAVVAGVQDAVWVGHSVSCQAVLELAAEHPGLARGMVLAAPTGDPRPWRLLRQAAGFVADPFLEPLAVIPAVAEPYLRAGIPRWLRTWVAAGRHDAMAAAKRCKAAGLVVMGRRDPVVRLGFAQELAAVLPQGRCVVLEHGAHAVPFDAAEEFNAEVVRFARELAGALSS